MTSVPNYAWLIVAVGGVLLIAATPRGEIASAKSWEASPEHVAEVTDSRITEASGICASKRFEDCYYVHNDSGDTARVFLIDRSGAVRLEIRLTGAESRDWEDIALAERPGEQGAAVFVGDIGDNARRRDSIAVYWFSERDLPELSEKAAVVPVAVQSARLRYPAGARNAEALCIAPQAGLGLIITKSALARDAEVYAWPLAAADEKSAASSQPTTLKKIATLDPPATLGPDRVITAADLAPSERRLLLRSYLSAWEYRLPSDSAKPLEALFSAEPVRVPVGAEPQGEAICYATGGEAVLTISEGNPTQLYETRWVEKPTD